MKKLIIAASLLFASFSGIASSDALGDFISALPSGLPTQQATVQAKTFPKGTPEYVRSLYSISEKQKKVLEYALRVGNKYDRKTGKLVDVDKTKRLGYHLAAIAWIESRACENLRNKKAAGCWQVQYSTASKRAGAKETKKQMLAHLRTLKGGSEFAIYELDYWLMYHDGNLKRALASYNAGFKYKSTEAKQYAAMVMKTAKILEENQIL